MDSTPFDYEIEDYNPEGPPCPICHHAQEIDYAGKLFCPQCIAAHYDRYAKQDTSVTMRLSSQLLEDVKQTAQRQGIRNYQQWVRQVLMEAVRRERKVS